MRSTSSAHKVLAVCLAATLVVSAAWPPVARAGTPDEPCILLKISASSISEDAAKGRLDALQVLLEKRLRVRWVPLPDGSREAEDAEPFPVPDGKALGRISARIKDATAHMDRMETAEAARSLEDAETIARSFRFGETMRPYLAELFLRKGLLMLWAGQTGRAERMLARARALRPEFHPDPALFSPLFREAWKRAGERPPLPAEVLVSSLPPGATIRVDGRNVGTTPGRARIDVLGPVSIRVSAEGYRTGEKTGQWLPGDFGAMEFPLVRDRKAVLTELLASSPDGGEAAPLLSEMLVETGARRVVLLILEKRAQAFRLRVLSLAAPGETPSMLGEVEWPEGAEGNARAAASTADLLAGAGWPARAGADKVGAAWYDTWWFWALVGVAVAGTAVGIAGGGGGGGAAADGGGSGSSTGTIGVDF